MTLETLYQHWWNHEDDPDYDGAVSRAAEEATGRLLAYQDLHQLAPTVENFRQLVDVEFATVPSELAVARRQRWLDKVQVLTDMLTPGQALIDCGSGFGTEDIAFALAGAEVVAVDLYPTFVRVLDSRVETYSRVFGVDLSSRVQGIAAHLPTFEPSRGFDFAWSSESIEHIAPLPDFLQRLSGWVKSNGTVVISNDNAINPLKLGGIILERRSLRAKFETRTDPSTGTPVNYGMEAIISPVRLRSILHASGFSSVEMRMFHAVPARAIRGKLTHRLAKMAEVATQVRGVRSFIALDYVAIASH
jgi:SAM-dependent methyltransferase